MSMTQKVNGIKCAECDYLPHTSISGIRTCPKNCYGEICFIVVNNYYNETLVSGCVNVDTETRTFFLDHAYCYKTRQYTICGCTTSDRCNSPQAPFSIFTFISMPFFEDCQFISKHENTTLKGDSETKLPLKIVSIEGAKSINNVETTVENERIRDSLSIITRPITANPMVIYSTKSIKSINDETEHYDKRNEVNTKFIDNVIRNLLPNVGLQRIIDPEKLAAANYSKFDDQIKGKAYERIKIRCDSNNSSRQCELSKMAVLLIFSLLFYSH